MTQLNLSIDEPKPTKEGLEKAYNKALAIHRRNIENSVKSSEILFDIRLKMFRVLGFEESNKIIDNQK